MKYIEIILVAIFSGSIGVLLQYDFEIIPKPPKIVTADKVLVVEYQDVSNKIKIVNFRVKTKE